jgi:heptosyltransferase-2/heptosyltransferase-3
VFRKVTNVPIGSVPTQNQPFELTRTPVDADLGAPAPPAAQPRLGALPRRPLQPIVIAFGRLGDMVMVSSVLHLLHHRFGRRCLVVGAGTWNTHLYRGHPDVERVVSFARHVPFVLSLAWWRVLWALHSTSPGPVYVCERQPRQLARIRRMLAISAVDPARCLFIDDVCKDEAHWIDRFMRLGQQTPARLAAAGNCLPLAGMPVPRLSVSDAERGELQAWLREKGWMGRKLVLVQPGNFRSMSRRREQWRQRKTDDKAWPLESWVSLLRRVHATMPDSVIALCGSPEEGAMLREIQRAAGVQDIVAAELPLRQLLALSESAHSMISVDTGPAHAAAALGLPLVVMFGAESQRQWMPRSPSGSAVVGLGGPPMSNRVDQIPVEAVFNAWYSLLPSIQQAPRPLPDPIRRRELT